MAQMGTGFGVKSISCCISALVLLLPLLGWGQVSITPGGAAVTQNFNTVSTSSATAALPTGWKADKTIGSAVRTLGTYAAAGTATEQIGGTTVGTTGGIYNLGSGNSNTGTDRAIGGLGSNGVGSVNVYSPQLSNSSGASVGSFTISYNVEKYRSGSNTNGFTVQLYYSTDGSSWTSAGSDFTTFFPADANSTTTANPAPITSQAVTSKALNVAVASGTSIYLAWNYSVASPGTASSNAQALGVDDVSITPNSASPNPAPTITSISPSTGAAGGTAFTLTVDGTGFVSNSVVNFNGAALATTYVSATQLTATVPASAIAASGSFPVTVTSPAPGGGTSGSATFTVTNPLPVISSLSPNNATAGGAAFTLTVNGTGFVNGSTTFSFGGTSYTPNAAGFSSTSFTVNIPAAAIATPGNKAVVVTNPAPNGGTATATFSVNTGACLAETFDGSLPPAGWTATSVAVATGTAARSGNAVNFNAVSGELTSPAVAYPLSLDIYVQRTSSTITRALEVQVSTTSQTSGFTTVATFDNTNLTTAFTLRTVNLAAYSGADQVWIRIIKTGGTTAELRLDDLSVFCATNPSTSVGTISGSPFCLGTAGTPVTVPFTVSYGPFTAGNTFTAYISNDNFVTKYALNAPQAGTTGGTISGLIPNNAAIASGSNYRIRVEASNPVNNGQRNTADLTVTNFRTNEVTALLAQGGNAQATLSWTLPATCANRVVVIARQGSPVTVRPTGTFTANAAFGSGTDLGTMANPGQYVVYDGPGTGVTVTGLTNLSTYHFAVFTSNGDGFSNGSATSVTPVVPATVAEVYVPQIISGHAAGSTTHTERVPYAFRVTLGSLTPNATYRYYNSIVGANAADPDGPTDGGAGNPIYADGAGSFRRVTTRTLTSGGTFTTNAAGSYTGWFMVEPTGSDRLDAGDLVKMRIILNDGNGGTQDLNYVTVPSTVSVRQLGTTSGSATQATAVYGNSFGTASNFVLAYDNEAGTGRPLAVTFIESDGSVNTTGNFYAAFYSTNVEGRAGAYGFLTPNDNASGIRRIEQRSLASGQLVGCASTDADGIWAGGANTVSPSGGGSAPRVLTTGDTPFQPAAPTAFTPAVGIIGSTVTITGTNFTTGPNPTVSFNGGPAVAAATVNAAGTSLTVVVPAGAGSGPLSVTAGCATPVTVPGGSFTVSPAVFYTKATGDVGALATYGDQPDGSGTAPVSFSVSGLTFNINGTGRTFASSWTVGGTGTRVVLGAGAELIIPAAATFTGTLDMAANSLLTVLNPTVSGLTLGTLAAGSTVNYAQAGGLFTVPTAPAYRNLALTNGSKRFVNTTTIAENLTLENTFVSGTVLNGGAAGSYTTVSLGGNYHQLSGVTYDRTRNFTLALNNTTALQTLFGNGGVIEVYQLRTSGAVQAALSGANGGTVLMVGNSTDGGVNLQSSTSSLQLNAGTTLRFFFDGTNGGGANFFTTHLGFLKLIDGSNLELYRTTTNEFTLGNLRIDPTLNTVSNLLLNSGASGASELTLNDNLNVTGTLSLLRGTLVLGGNTLSLSGSLVTATGGFFSGSSSSDLVFTGSGPLGTLPFAAGATARSLRNLTFNRTGGTATLGAPISLSGTLALSNGILSTSTTNLPTLTTAGSITGGSASSYINGPIARATASGARTVFFPIGKGGNYRPLTLNTATQTSTTTYTAEQFEGAPSASALTGGLTRVSSTRYFTLTPQAAPTGYTGSLTISFGADDFVNYPGDASFVVAGRTSAAAPWANLGRSGTDPATISPNGGLPVTGALISGTFSTFGNFALASTSTANGFPGLNPLPVELSSFSAVRQPAGVALRWTTASEKNNAYFDVERSLDGQLFAAVARVEGNGNSARALTYAALDATAPQALLYYRLRQVDADGKATLSAVVTVAGGSHDFTVFPNPTRSTVSFAVSAPTSYRVLNQLGQPVLKGSAEAGLATVSVEALPAGIYHLEVQTAKGRVVRKFVKE